MFSSLKEIILMTKVSYSLIQSINNDYSVYDMPGSVPGGGGTAVSKRDKALSPQ